MNNVRSISSSDTVLEDASRWVYKLDRGLSDEEKKEIELWLAQSEQHRLALIKVGQVWDKAEVLHKLADLFPSTVEGRASRSRTLSAMAACLSILVFSAWLVSTSFLNSSIGSTAGELAMVNPESLYKTAVGEHTRVNLPDGTELFLNTNTTVRVNYSDAQRLLVLEQGELHVQVAHDENRPLSVLVGGQIVQAVGTAFNIELRADRSIDLIVTEGKVLVGAREQVPVISLEAPDPIVMPVTSLAISEQEQIRLGQVDKAVEPIALEEMEIQLSWRHGNLIFRGEPLEEAVREVSRYTSAEFVFLDESLKEVKVAGLFETGDVDGLLAALDDSFQIDSQRVGRRILLSSR